jgi:putative oxidoreductase
MLRQSKIALRIPSSCSAIRFLTGFANHAKLLCDQTDFSLNEDSDSLSSNRWRATVAIDLRTKLFQASNCAEMTHKGDSTMVMDKYALIAARVLVSMVFFLNGLNVIGQSFAAHEMAAHGVPVSLIPTLILGARALQLVAGTGLVLGIYPRVSCVALLLFLIPATLMAHAFWQVAGTSPLYVLQLINFFKNVCMAGGLVFIAAAKDQPLLFPARPTMRLAAEHAHRWSSI